MSIRRSECRPPRTSGFGYARAYWDAKQSAIDQLLKPRRMTKGSRATSHARNVVGVALGIKRVGRHRTGRRCVTILVEKKIPRELIPKRDLLPESFGRDVEVDVVEVGRFRRLTGSLANPAHPEPVAPVRPGCSLAFRSALSGPAPSTHPAVAGTLAAVVDQVATGKTFLLSNNHVLADEDACPLGWPTLQPGPLDNGTRVVATLADFQPLDEAAPNLVDAAISEVSPGTAVDGKFLDSRMALVSPAPVQPFAGMVVHKVGRTTGHTQGVIENPSAVVVVDDYRDGPLTFHDQILFSSAGNPFGADGDSGSLVVDMFTSRPVGLLFATSPSVFAANPIDAVLSIWGLKIRI